MPGLILKNAFLLLFDVDEFLFGFKEFGFQVTPAFLRFGHVRAVRVVVLKIFFVIVIIVYVFSFSSRKSAVCFGAHA